MSKLGTMDVNGIELVLVEMKNTELLLCVFVNIAVGKILPVY
jgi:hypothetical protein